MIKKFMSVSLLAAVIFSGAIYQSAHAAEANDNLVYVPVADITPQESFSTTEGKTYDELYEEYDLKSFDLSTLPEGTEVIKVDSEEELEALLQYLDSEESVQVVDDSNKISLFAAGVIKKETTKKAGLATIHLEGKTYVESSGSFRYIDNAVARTWADGVTFALDWTEIYADADIAKNKTSVNFDAKGNLKYVMVVQGVGTFFDRNVDLSLFYSLY
ncbi:hypothetical protein [Brevibacillus sp. SIMBA_040]|uniref:hypothetical protein n=1 Tax=unclassified Brevibacillus TaxID=2684853 RepID=UPI00397CDB19